MRRQVWYRLAVWCFLWCNWSFTFAEERLLLSIDFEDHGVAEWRGAYGSQPLSRWGFGHVVTNEQSSGNHYLERRPGFVGNAGTLDLNWRGVLFTNAIPAWSTGEALQFSCDIRLFLRDDLKSLPFLDFLVTPCGSYGPERDEQIKNDPKLDTRLGIRLMQGDWDKGGTCPDGVLSLALDPYRSAESVLNINLHEIGCSNLGRPDADTESDELSLTYTLVRLDEEGRWIAVVDLVNRMTGANWRAFTELTHFSVYEASELFFGMESSWKMEGAEGLELDNLELKIIPFDSAPLIEGSPVLQDQQNAGKSVSLNIPDPGAVSLFSIPETLRRLKRSEVVLRSSLAALPDLQEPLQFEAYGYHGGYFPALKEVPDKPRWTLELNFPFGRLQDLILVPALDRRFNVQTSYGFPERFRILLLKSDGTQFPIYECMDLDFSTTGRYPVIVPILQAEQSNNRIRIEVFRGAREGLREFFALDEIFAVAENEIFRAKDVDVSSEFESLPYWSSDFLIDQKTHLGLPLGVSDELVKRKNDYSVIFAGQTRNDDCMIELDLGVNRLIGWISLFPATPSEGILIPGYGFPGKIRVEATPQLGDGERGKAFEMPVQWLGGNPGNNVVRLDGYLNEARWIRLYIDELPIHNGVRTFALGEVTVYKSNHIYPIKSFELSGFPAEAYDDVKVMADKLAGGRPVMLLRDWIFQIEKRRVGEQQLNQLLSTIQMLETRWAQFKRTLLMTSIICVVSGALVVAAYFGIQRRRSVRRMNMQIAEEKHHTEIEQMKIRFFTHISHELRTPLTVILGPLEKVLHKHPEPSVQQPVSMALRNVKKLQGLVDQLLDFRKLQDGRDRLSLQDIDLVQHMRNGFDVYRSLAMDREIDYRLVLPTVPYRVSLDAGKFQKISDNLISNALKYTPSNGGVTVSLSVSPDCGESKAKLTLVVEDSGQGIAEKDLPYVFEQYYRADGLESTGAVGSGIGLAFVNELVNLMDGTIKVESPVVKGKGTRFTVELPVGLISGLQEAEKLAETQLVKGNVTEAIIEDESLGDHSYEGSEQVAPSLQENPKLIIIDDNPDIRDYVQSELKESYTVMTAENGEVGLKLIHDVLPDLIISDVMMPVMNGIELCRRLKTDEIISHIPVILLTARGSEEHQIEGLETGADDYISKPFSMPVLELRIRNLLESRRKMRERFGRDISIDPSRITVTSADEVFLKKTIEVVENNMEDAEFDVKSFADQLFMSRRNLQNKLKALTDQSPQGFIRTIRLKRARQLIEQNYGQIAEVAFKVGFHEPTNFSRAFKQEFGITPTQFRNSLEP